MLEPIWIGLGLLTIGIVLMTLFGLIWPRSDNAAGIWGFRVGILLTAIGSALAVVFS